MRGLILAIAEIALSGRSGLSPIFETDPVKITDSTPQQLKLGRIQLRVAETALAHGDYQAAFELASNNATVRQAALLRLEDIHRINENLDAEREIYQRLLQENHTHAAAVSRLAALNAQGDNSQQGFRKTSDIPLQPHASEATTRTPSIEGKSPILGGPAQSKPKLEKDKRKNVA